MIQGLFAIAAVTFFLYADFNERQASRYILFCIVVFIIIRIFEGGSGGDEDFYRRPGRR